MILLEFSHHLNIGANFSRDLLAGIEELLRPFVQIANLSNDALTQLLLYGDKDLSYEMNSDILRLTIRFIRETGRFD